MTEPNRPSTPAGSGGGFRSPFSLRTGAILLMVVGAAGFVAARLLFGDQVLCLLVSTLVVFAGLGLIVAGRRTTARGEETGVYGQRPLPPPGSAQSTARNARANPRQMPRGLRAAARQQSSRPMQPPQTLSRRPEEYPLEPARTEPLPPSSPALEPAPVSDHSLLDEVITTFENQGARVDIETQRDERGILTIQAPDGLTYTSLVLQTAAQVEVAEVRALYALMTTSGSVGGYLISPGVFSQRAYDWASQHRIRLVAADEIEELGI